MQALSKRLLQRLQKLDIERGCQDWRQYNKATKLAKCLSSTPDEYEYLIEMIKNYLNI